MQNGFTVILNFFTADIEYQFFQRSWHTILTSDVSLSPWSIRDMHQIIHRHTQIDLLKAIVFFSDFWIVECFKCIIPYMRLCQQSQRLLHCVKKEKGSQIHLYFAMWHNRAHCSQLSIFCSQLSCHRLRRHVTSSLYHYVGGADMAA